MNPTPEQIAKLPKWAQDELKRLERIASVAQSENAVLRKETPPTGVSWQSMMEPESNLPECATVIFMLTKKWGVRCALRNDPKDEKYLDINGDGILSIQPRASNVIRITVI